MTKSGDNLRRLRMAGLLALFMIIFVISFAVGKYPVSPSELMHVVIGKISGAPKDWSNELELVIFKIRMPRILAGALIGAGLSCAGAAYQGLFRNPLVSPDVLGASAGAGFGAALSLFLSLGYFAVMVNAFVCGIAAVFLAYIISTRSRQNPTLGMVLAGIMISSVFNSATSYIKLIADPNNVLPAITYWLMGSISSVKERDLMLACVPIILGMLIMFLLRWKLNLLTLSEDEARSMGVNTKVLRALIVFSATMVTAACVSISGLIGWVGLAIPHLARMIVGYDNRSAVPASMLIGASFLMLVDDIARTLATAEIPLGILTSFVGAPFFIYLIMSRRSDI